MKKIILLCTITLCGVISAVGYFIACSCGNGAMSSPASYLETDEWLLLSVFMAITLISLIAAIKETKK